MGDKEHLVNEINKGAQAMADIDESLGVKKTKKLRYHVDLAPEMGKSFMDLAEKMGLTLSAVVKLFLMDDYQKLSINGFDYIYLGVADKPKELPFLGQ